MTSVVTKLTCIQQARAMQVGRVPYSEKPWSRMTLTVDLLSRVKIELTKMDLLF